MKMSLEYVMLSEINQYQTINTVTAYMSYLKENSIVSILQNEDGLKCPKTMWPYSVLNCTF